MINSCICCFKATILLHWTGPISYVFPSAKDGIGQWGGLIFKS